MTLWLVTAIIVAAVLVALGVIIAVLKRQWVYILYMAVPVVLAVGLIIIGELTDRQSYPASIPFMAGIWVVLIAVFVKKKSRE